MMSCTAYPLSQSYHLMPGGSQQALTGLLSPLILHTAASDASKMQIRWCLILIPPPPAAFNTIQWFHFALGTKPDSLSWSLRPCMASPCQPHPPTHLRPTSLPAVDDSHTGFLSFPPNTSCSLSTLGDSLSQQTCQRPFHVQMCYPSRKMHAEAHGFRQEEFPTV